MNYFTHEDFWDLINQEGAHPDLRAYDNDQATEPPDFLQVRLGFIECAQALESFNLYDPLPEGEVGVLPELPPVVETDLKIAYQTFLRLPPPTGANSSSVA